MLLGGNASQLAPMDSMLPSISSTPRPEGTTNWVSPEQQNAGMPWSDFYSKYETPEVQVERQNDRTEVEDN